MERMLTVCELYESVLGMGMTARRWCLASGVNPGTLSRILSGESPYPRMATYERLRRGLSRLRGEEVEVDGGYEEWDGSWDYPGPARVGEVVGECQVLREEGGG